MKRASVKDEQLVRRAKKGDADSFGKLVTRYQDKIYRLARRMTETDEDAEDVLQEAFVKAFKSLRGFKERSKFSTWLYRITVNLALMKLRQKRVNAVSLDQPVEAGEGQISRDIEDASPDPLAALLKKESQEILGRAINELPPDRRAVFVLRHVEGLSTQETARILRLTVSAVKSKLHRTRIALRERLLSHIRNQSNGESIAQ